MQKSHSAGNSKFFRLTPLTPALLHASGFFLSRELLVFYALGHFRIGPEAAFSVFFIIGIIAFKPFDMAVAFKSQNMRGNTVEEPAIVRDDNRATGEVFQAFFQRAQRFNIQIIGRFIEQQAG